MPSTTHRLLTAAGALAGLLSLTSCAADLDDRLGAEGEACFADTDCRLELVCARALCVPIGEGELPCGDRCPASECVDGQCQGDEPLCGDGVCDDEERGSCPSDCSTQEELTCDQVCEVLAECVDQDPQDCTFDCKDSTENLDADERQEIFECLVALDCEDFFNGGAERCVGDIDGTEPAPDPTPPPDPGPDPGPDPDGQFRFVLIEDGGRLQGDQPGADIDAVSISGPDGVERFASMIQDVEVDDRRNNAPDPGEALGAPDSDCEIKGIVALNGGFIILSFDTSVQPGIFGLGDTIRVYELGQTQCGRFDDDPYSVAISDDLGSFIFIGQGLGSGEFPVRF